MPTLPFQRVDAADHARPTFGVDAEPSVDNMIRIRFTRRGRRKLPFYRIIAIDGRRPRDGRALEFLGWYDPISKISKVDADGVRKWISYGAQPSDSVRSLLQKLGVIEVRPWSPPPSEPPRRWSRDNPAPGSKAWKKRQQEAREAEATGATAAATEGGSLTAPAIAATERGASASASATTEGSSRRD